MKGALFYGLNPYFRLGIDETNKLSLQQKIGNTWYKTISSNVVNTGEWMHIVATHDSSTGHDYLYINGELV